MQCDNARFPYHRSTLRSCETRESRGRARLPVTARGYSIFELEVYDFPFLPLLILNSVSKSGGSMGCEKGKDRRGSRFLENLNLIRGLKVGRGNSRTTLHLDSLFPSLSVASSRGLTIIVSKDIRNYRVDGEDR